MVNLKKHKSLLAFLLDLILITISFFSAIYLKRGNFELTQEYRLLLFSFYSIWIIASIALKKYALKKPRNIREGLNPFFRSYIYMCVLLFFIIFVFKLFSYSRFIILATLIIYLSIEIFAYAVFYIYKWGPNANIVNGNDNPIGLESYSELQDEEAHIDIKERQVRESLKLKLKETYLRGQQSPVFTDYFPPKLYNFLDTAINLDAINASDSLMFDSNIADNVKSILNNRLEFIGNLHKINDIKRINKFFIAVNQKLIRGGYFLGVVETIEQRLKRKFSKFPKLLRKFFYLLDFIWTRIFPKLAILKKIYFMIHGKDRRIISKPEVMGRLNFCGFKIVKMEELDKKLYFIVKKVRVPLEDKNPSYGPIFKQKRIGLNGEIIYTYKFRTMHPYSEYLRSVVLESHGYSSSGNGVAKINNDFRVTTWGKFLRKYWLDELPQLINVLRGEMKLVGVRPLGKSFLSEYPEAIRKERINIKPGCIPPYVAHIHHSVKEYIEADIMYLNSYKKHPIWTDIKYFFWGIYNIASGRIKSA